MLGVSMRLFELTGEASFKSDVVTRVNYYRTSSPKSAGGLMLLWGRGNLRAVANAAFIMRVAVCSGAMTDTTASVKLQLDYILGASPNQMSYVVAFGASYRTHDHHRGAHDSPNTITSTGPRRIPTSCMVPSMAAP